MNDTEVNVVEPSFQERRLRSVPNRLPPTAGAEIAARPGKPNQRVRRSLRM